MYKLVPIIRKEGEAPRAANIQELVLLNRMVVQNDYPPVQHLRFNTATDANEEATDIMKSWADLQYPDGQSAREANFDPFQLAKIGMHLSVEFASIEGEVIRLLGKTTMGERSYPIYANVSPEVQEYWICPWCMSPLSGPNENCTEVHCTWSLSRHAYELEERAKLNDLGGLNFWVAGVAPLNLSAAQWEQIAVMFSVNPECFDHLRAIADEVRRNYP